MYNHIIYNYEGEKITIMVQINDQNIKFAKGLLLT